MQEDEIKKLFVKYLEKNKIEFIPEVHLGDCAIDFLVKLEGKWIGVEVKGDRANEIRALGQFINYYTYLSHVILCTSRKFALRFLKKIKNNPEIKHLEKKVGLWLVENPELHIPDGISYYFHLRKKRIGGKKKSYKYPKYGVLDEIDKQILELVNTRDPITLGEIRKATNLSYDAARKRIKNLEHFKYIKIISKYPISVTLGERGVKNQERTAIT